MAKYDLKKLLEEEVVDKLIAVIAKGDKALEEKIAKLGTRVGSANTFADLPTVDQNGRRVDVGDVCVLTTKDGDHPAGLYSRKPDNSGWNDTPDINYDELGISNALQGLKAGSAGNVTTDANGVYQSVDGLGEDNKFVTPTELATILKDLVTAVTKLNQASFQPKQGDETLYVVGKDAEENTQQFVTANQLKATFTQQEVQAKYDAL